MIGRTLSHYEIVGELGRGGMGEVYRARDTKLKRDVAIKVLPPAFAEDRERLARFEREAQLLASLNHPNIAGIYGMEEVDGVSALVLELVEGPTLAERIAEARIPIDDAIAIAKQIVDALEAAHADGIIHRDLKPVNIKLTENGEVKVLDFGLAKALEGEAPEPVDSSLSQSPTLTRQGTAVGVILGTAAYMSPEQAKGKRVDRRGDIWAFGAVLYEMLTGKRAFAAEDVSETLAAVLRAEPDWRELPPDTPENIRQLLRLCLLKDRRQRVQAIGDVRLAIEGAFEQESRLGERRSSFPLMFAAAFILGGFLGGLVVSSSLDRDSDAIVRFRVPIPRSPGFPVIEMAVSDAHLAMRMGDDIYLRPLGEIEATRLTHEGLAVSPAFSPDGQWLAFVTRGQLKKVAIEGDSASIALCDVTGPISGVSWGSADTLVFAQNPNGIYRVSASGGEPELVVRLSEGEIGEFPQALPGEDAILFTLRPSGSTPWEEAQIVVHSLRTNEQKTLIEGGRAGIYVSTGHLIYSHERSLLAVPFDAASWEVGGGAVSLLDMAPPGWTFSREKTFELSRTGTLAYLTNDASQVSSVVWLSPNGVERELNLPPKPYRWLDISPDGNRIVLGLEDDPRNADIWIHDLTQNVTTAVTFDAAADLWPVWTADGERIVFWSERDGGGLFWKRSDGTGAAERLTDAAVGRSFPYSVSPDGRVLVFNTGEQGDDMNIKTVTLDDHHLVEPLLETSYDERRASISPNGRWIAYMSDESGEYNVFVRPFPNVRDGQWQVSSDGGISPNWSEDGASLFFWKGQSLVQVNVEDGPTFTYSSPELVVEGAYLNGARAYDDSPDGERILLIKDAQDSTREVNVVLNWFEELRERVPVDD